jgi:hypothetical protein
LARNAAQRCDEPARSVERNGRIGAKLFELAPQTWGGVSMPSF